MKIIIGLGNPGREYFFTRHNIGFRFIDFMAKELKVSFRKSLSCRSLFGQVKFKNKNFLLAKPLTFMNESGLAVKRLVDKFTLPLENLLIVYDDIDLPLGTMRFRAKGGPGTHRGMQSCQEVLGESHFSRLRFGIKGERGNRDLSDYVLENFTPEEEIILKKVMLQAKEQVLTFLRSEQFH